MMENKTNINSEDSSLSNFLSSEEAKEIIVKNYRITNILIICSFIFTFIGILYLLPYLTSKEVNAQSDFRVIYYYRIYPVSHIIVTLAGVAFYIILRMSYKNFLEGILENDSGKFNNGFHNFYKINLLAVALFIVQMIQYIFFISLRSISL